MEVLNLGNANDVSKAIALCSNLISRNALVPVIGAGFSMGAQTNLRGKVEGAGQLRDKLYNYIVSHSGYAQNDLEDIKRAGLSEVAEDFWRIYPKIPENSKSEWFEYWRKNYQEISHWNETQKSFLDLNWQTIFTLNYDSLIEDYCKQYTVLVPFSAINRYNKRPNYLYKLHGDAKKYIDTGDKRYCILSRRQYVDSLKSAENGDMLNILQTTFLSKSILFFGCGLSEELDLLYTSELKLQEKSREIDTEEQAVIYVSYENGGDSNSDLSGRMIDRLKDYNVTHIFRVFSAQDLVDFFKKLLVEKRKQAPILGHQFLEKYHCPEFFVKDSADPSNRKYLFENSLLWKGGDTKSIVLPSFFIPRKTAKGIISSIENKPTLIYFLDGNFYSGKTYCLLCIAKHFSTKSVYIFPSTIRPITNDQLDYLFSQRNSILIFDSNSLPNTLVKKITEPEYIRKANENKIKIVVAIDKSDAAFYAQRTEMRSLSTECAFYSLKGSLSGKAPENEIQELNTKIGPLSLISYKQGNSLLDFVVNNENFFDEINQNRCHFVRPVPSMLETNSVSRIKALIMLGTESRISASRANKFNVDQALCELLGICKPENSSSSIIERDYSSNLGDISGYEYVCNSKYWVVELLSKYANKLHIREITQAYYEILCTYRKQYNDDLEFYQKSEPYYFFDHIQELFNYRWYKGSSALMNSIYDKLMLLLSNSFQFLHQKAKGKLIIAQVQKSHEHFDLAANTLNEAILHINRAIDLAEKVPDAKNINVTLLHMKYTKGRIMIEYSCIDKRYVSEAVSVCYEVCRLQEGSSHIEYDFRIGDKKDKSSFQSFKNTLVLDETTRKSATFDVDKAGYLLTKWTGMRTTISAKKGDLKKSRSIIKKHAICE